MKPGIFLRADWRHLAVLSYEIDPQWVEPFLPPGLEIDFWQGRTYVSLVAFLFQRTRVCRIAIPFHCNFPEVNLRFYVLRPMPEGMRRGVVFLRELAPRRAVAYVARKFYGEKYLAVPMRAIRLAIGRRMLCNRSDIECSAAVPRNRFARGIHYRALLGIFRRPLRCWQMHRIPSRTSALDRPLRGARLLCR
jgi:uncharacterized protein YqjF (DUF2071 family)